jgi:hypothetical protein
MPIEGKFTPATPAVAGARTPAEARESGPARTFNDHGLTSDGRAGAAAPPRIPQPERRIVGATRSPIGHGFVGAKHDGHPIQQEQPQPDPSLTDTADAPVEEWRRQASERRVASERAALRTELRARDRKLAEAESRLTSVQRRLDTYRHSPHLALQDLGDLGVSFDMLAQAVANGSATPDQLAASAVDELRREVADLRSERDRERQEAAQRQELARAAAEREAVAEYKDEIRGALESAAAQYPVLSATLDRGSIDTAFEVADRLFNETGRVPSHDEVLRATEKQLAGELAELQRALAGRPDDGQPSAPAGADRRQTFLARLDDILRRIP